MVGLIEAYLPEIIRGLIRVASTREEESPIQRSFLWWYVALGPCHMGKYVPRISMFSGRLQQIKKPVIGSFSGVS